MAMPEVIVRHWRTIRPRFIARAWDSTPCPISLLFSGQLQLQPFLFEWVFPVVSFGHSNILLVMSPCELFFNLFLAALIILGSYGYSLFIRINVPNFDVLRVFICKLKSLKLKSFDIFFYLWGNDGPHHWRRAYELWIHEEELKWSVLKQVFIQILCWHRPVRFSVRFQVRFYGFT